MDDSNTARRDILVLIGHALYGAAGWQASLARELGRLNPINKDGGLVLTTPEGERYSIRAAIDDRLVRRWISGDLDIPDWIGPALIQLCSMRCRELAAAADRVADRW
jgi:hypothetical protein